MRLPLTLFLDVLLDYMEDPGLTASCNGTITQRCLVGQCLDTRTAVVELSARLALSLPPMSGICPETHDYVDVSGKGLVTPKITLHLTLVAEKGRLPILWQ